jgi:plastocyanin
MKLPMALVGAAVLACSAAPATAGGSVNLKVVNYTYKAEKVTISKGTTVHWNWVKGDDKHNVTFHGFHSKTQKTGTYSHTFNTPGTYRYHCTIHGAKFGMHGIITVK